MPSQKIVVFGRRGQLGVELVTVFQQRGYDVAGFDRSKVDISDAAQVAQVFATVDPAIVINAAAYNQVDVAEKEPLPAMQANGLAVRNLAMACRQHDARFVHFSHRLCFRRHRRPRLYRGGRPPGLSVPMPCPSWPASCTRKPTWTIR